MHYVDTYEIFKCREREGGPLGGGGGVSYLETYKMRARQKSPLKERSSVFSLHLPL